MSEQLASDLFLGFTIVELKCIECGDVKFVRTPGAVPHRPAPVRVP